jgi:hypothetical protein
VQDEGNDGIDAAGHDLPETPPFDGQLLETPALMPGSASCRAKPRVSTRFSRPPEAA